MSLYVVFMSLLCRCDVDPLYAFADWQGKTAESVRRKNDFTLCQNNIPHDMLVCHYDILKVDIVQMSYNVDVTLRQTLVYDLVQCRIMSP